MKLNYDASFKIGNKFGTVGVALRNSRGDLVDVFGAYERVISIKHLELLSVHRALELAQSRGW